MSLIDPILVLVLLLNFFMLGTSRLRAVIQASAFQGALLGLLSLLAHGDTGPGATALSLVAAVIKAFVIPGLLHRAMSEARIRREVEPLIGLMPSLFVGAGMTLLAMLFARTLPLRGAFSATLLVPTSLATVLVGLLILITRRKAITQVVGYLVMENGIFTFGLTLLGAMPFLVELGVLLDLLVGMFIMGIIINDINREFSSLDISRLTALKE